MSSPRNAKIMVVSAVCLMALAGVIFLLLVVPTMRGGAPVSMAQDDMGPEPTPGADAAAMPGPGGDPGMPGGPGAPDMAMPGGPDMGMGAPGGAPAAAAATPKRELPPTEPSSANPFTGAGVVSAGAEQTIDQLHYTSYGNDWSRIPITLQKGFPAPEVPERAAPAPPPSAVGTDKPLRVTSIMWTKDGQALAVYEYGEGADMESGTIRPGDRVGSWQVVEIRQDLVIVEDRSSGGRTEVYLTHRAPKPEKKATTPTTGQGGRQPRTNGRQRPPGRLGGPREP